MKKLPLILAIVLLCAALFSGCNFGVSSGSTPAPKYTASPNIDPCQLISKQEAEQLVGNALLDAVAMPTEQPSVSAAAAASVAATGSPAPSVAPTATPSIFSEVTCFYETAAAGGHFLQITVLQTTPGMAENQQQSISAKDYYDAMKGKGPSPVNDPSMTMVQGVGDEAFIVAPGIHILFRGYYIVIGVGDPTVQANQDILMAAGKLAVKNLAAKLGVPEPTEAPTASPTSTAK